MELSMQMFCKTASLMLDDKLPPSSVFCTTSHKEGEKLLYTAAGDIIACKCITQVRVKYFMN